MAEEKNGRLENQQTRGRNLKANPSPQHKRFFHWKNHYSQEGCKQEIAGKKLKRRKHLEKLSKKKYKVRLFHTKWDNVATVKKKAEIMIYYSTTNGINIKRKRWKCWEKYWEKMKHQQRWDEKD